MNNNETVMINKDFLRSMLGTDMEVFSIIINNSVDLNNEMICILTQDQVSNLANISLGQTKRIFKKLISSNLIIKQGIAKYKLNKDATKFIESIKEIYSNESK